MSVEVDWLRAQIQARKATAEAAAAVYPPPWTFRPDPHSEHERDNFIWDADEPFIKSCVQCEHSGIHREPGEHIAWNDPRQIIADCEKDLALLDMAEPEVTSVDVVALIARGYIHRPGYPFEDATS